MVEIFTDDQERYVKFYYFTGTGHTESVCLDKSYKTAVEIRMDNDPCYSIDIYIKDIDKLIEALKLAKQYAISLGE